MKCIVLAGGRGERMWPLSRKDLPKQFIQIQNNHSIFQETIARNMAYCDEFIIVTSYEYRSLITNQMEAFKGVTYRCVYEEIPGNTTAAISLSCMDLQPSEYVFVVASSHLIDTGDCEGLTYKEAIIEGKKQAQFGKIAIFGVNATEYSPRFGYFTDRGKDFIEKPGTNQFEELSKNGIYQNIGMLLFKCGEFLNELRCLKPSIFKGCEKAYLLKKEISEGILYDAEALSLIESISVERSIIEETKKKQGIVVGFDWCNIGRLEDLDKTDITARGPYITYESDNTEVINRASDQAVVVNGIEDALVVNTEDAIYIGRKGESYKLRDIFQKHEELTSFTAHSNTVYRIWGYRENISEGKGYRIRKAVVLPGKTIYEHRHDQRQESWTIVEGRALITIDGHSDFYEASDTITVPAGKTHQISNPEDKPLVFIETSTGEEITDLDMISEPDKITASVTETDLGRKTDSIIKMQPSFKDYLWGGTKLKDIYNKQCDYDIIAESWELSAHHAGNSIVSSGRHKGMPFQKYIETVGKEVLGWKCAPLQSFPLLLKLIDAKDNLSIQVHPDDDYALANENQYGKSEMWYVIDADPGAGLYVGFSKDVSRSEISKRVRDNTIIDVLNFYPTKPGDVFFIPAGTVHAIGAGNLICELQQSSNCTYRIYDYNRVDKYGNTRELHLDKALDVLNYKKYEPEQMDIADDEGIRRIRCKYFEASIIHVDETFRLPLTNETFHAVLSLDGDGYCEVGGQKIDIKPGETVFIPSTNKPLTIDGTLTVIIARI